MQNIYIYIQKFKRSSLDASLLMFLTDHNPIEMPCRAFSYDGPLGYCAKLAA